MEGFVATGKQKHSQRREPCKRGPLPREASRVERMERKLETKVGAAVYATRKFIVEPVFGQIKQARNRSLERPKEAMEALSAQRK